MIIALDIPDDTEHMLISVIRDDDKSEIKTFSRNKILKARTTTAEPVKHVHWIGCEFDGYADGNPVFDTWICSACHEEYESEGEPPDYLYCPHCGAKMCEEDGDDCSI